MDERTTTEPLQKRRDSSRSGSRKLVRWDALPHQELWSRTEAIMGVGGAARASADSLRSVLKRRLPRMNNEDHSRYIEIECARIVESLRVLRETYRDHLGALINGPLAEMYWVVWQFGIRHWAVRLLQAAATSYVHQSEVKQKSWQQLFRKWPQLPSGTRGPATAQMSDLLDPILFEDLGDDRIMTNESATRAIERMVRIEALDAVEVGGVFGRDQQYWQVEDSQGTATPDGSSAFQEALNRQVSYWDDARPWSEGLARLFDATQEEVSYQFSCLESDGHKAQAAFAELSLIEQIVQKYLSTLNRDGSRGRSGVETCDWPGLMQALDATSITPAMALTGIAKQVLSNAQKKKFNLVSWTDCYNSRSSVILKDNKRRSVRSVVTHFLHNAARKADREVGKVWSLEKAKLPIRSRVRNRSKK